MTLGTPRRTKEQQRALLLVVGEGHRRADLGHGAVLAGRRPLDEPVDDGRQVASTARADDERHELRRGRRGLAAEEVLHDGLALGGRDLLVGQGVAQRIGRLDAAGEAEQPVKPTTRTSTRASARDKNLFIKPQ